MVRILKEQAYEGQKTYAEIACLSTDTKPKANLITGSKAVEVDTGDTYLFSEAGSGTWTKVAAGWVDPET